MFNTWRNKHDLPWYKNQQMRTSARRDGLSYTRRIRVVGSRAGCVYEYIIHLEGGSPTHTLQLLTLEEILPHANPHSGGTLPRPLGAGIWVNESR